MSHLNGSCLCGAVKIRVPDEFPFIGNCHCSECRKWTGSAYSAAAMVDAGDFEVTQGEDSLTTYKKTDETDLGFCKHCGSSMFSKKVNKGKYVIRLGVLDDKPTQAPAAHIFVGSKAPWYEISDGLQQFEKGPA